MKSKRNIKLFPTVKLNLSKSGTGMSIGPKEMNLALGSRGKYMNDNHTPFYRNYIYNIPNYQEIVIKTKNVDKITSSTFEELQAIIEECFQERISLKAEIKELQSKISSARFLNILSKIFIVGFFIKWFDRNFREKKEYLKELLEQLDNCYVNLDISATEELKEKYNQLYDSFEDVCKSHRKWSVISYYHINRVIERSSAGTHINRKYAIFSINPDLEIIRSAFNPLSIINSHVSIYLFPSFLLVKNRNDRFALIEFKDLYFHFDSDHFVEDGQVPKDAKVIDYAWLRSNKDGSPDLRFRDNYQIPICQYGRIDFQSAEGLNESFQISSYLHTKRFADCLERYMGEFV